MRSVFPTSVMLAIVLSCGQSWAADAKEFSTRSGMFTIMMPAGEHSGHQTRQIKIGKNNAVVEAAQCRAEDGTVYLAAAIGIPATVIRDVPADERFEILGDAIVKPLNGKMSDKKDIIQAPIPGKEFQIQTPDGAARLQLYTVGGGVFYALIQGKTKDDVNSKAADEFLASFKMSDHAKEVFPQVGR
jgi:hypothetical protein